MVSAEDYINASRPFSKRKVFEFSVEENLEDILDDDYLEGDEQNYLE